MDCTDYRKKRDSPQNRETQNVRFGPKAAFRTTTFWLLHET